MLLIRARDKDDWTEDFTPPPDRAEARLLPREADLRELALREFLAGELLDSKTTVERTLLAGLLQDVPGTLRMIG